jgi:hypothetical protein
VTSRRATKADLAARVAELEAEFAGAREQQKATSEILRVIASSPITLQPVLDIIATNAARVCGAAIPRGSDAAIAEVLGRNDPPTLFRIGVTVVEYDPFPQCLPYARTRLKGHVHTRSRTLSPTVTLAKAVFAAAGLLGQLPDYYDPTGRPEETA